VSGSAVAAVIEGTRPLLVEVQALCSRASYGAPQRVTTGFDRQRLALLLAVIEKRAGIDFSALDVFVNVVGGVRIVETASDAALVAALASSVYDREHRPRRRLPGRGRPGRRAAADRPARAAARRGRAHGVPPRIPARPQRCRARRRPGSSSWG
jgi:DNA repair protein RadA/Sms